MTFQSFFRTLTGFNPSPFQERVAAAVLAEKSIILRAPTGSGKTWAVVAPYLYSLAQNKAVADRLLYALPLRSLANSLHESTASAVAKCASLSFAADAVRLQTGEKRDDPQFQAAVTYTTIDQLLSSYLVSPVGLPARCGNINAGAAIGALLCFDEFHLLEPSKSMATALDLLETFCVRQALSRFVLMTATLSTATIDRLCSQLSCKLIEVPPDEVQQLPSFKNRRRRYLWSSESLSADAVLRVHGQGRSIVIANSVQRAQELFLELESSPKRDTATVVRLLHSRFFPHDRQRIEKGLPSCFGPKATESNVILVATQVIEAGMDISAGESLSAPSGNLHTEVAPMNAVIQRAGRCARRAGENGTVWCYPLELNAKGKPKYGPYSECASLVDDTAKLLQETLGETGAELTFHDELSLVDRVHTAWELKQLRVLDSSDHHDRIRAAMDGLNPGAVRSLIRDVQSINVIITENPSELRFDRKVWPEFLSIPPTSLFRAFSATTDRPWTVKAAREQDEQQAGPEGSTAIEWEPLEANSLLTSAGWIVAIHPEVAKYTDDLGLMIGCSGAPPKPRYRERPHWQRYAYSKETYEEHIHWVRTAGQRQEKYNHVATRRLAAAEGVSIDDFITWLDLLWALHDVGKLTVGWQDAIWDWQKRKTGTSPIPRPALAHSDYDPATDGALLKAAKRRPPHAAEGAFAVTGFLWRSLNGDASTSRVTAAMTAIARHHGPFTSSLSQCAFPKDAEEYVRATLETFDGELEEPDLVYCEDFGHRLFRCVDKTLDDYLPLYFYFCRRLRLADQASFAEARKHGTTHS